MKEQIRIGLLGFGSMGKVHTYCVDNLKHFFSPLPFDAKIHALCTTSVQRSTELARLYGFSYASDEDTIIADPNIDVIDICTPNIYHYETLKKAILAGKNIYCEKPLCTTASQAYEISRLAKENNTLCNIVFNNRHIAPICRAKELIDEGKLGNILSFSAEYHHNSALDPNKPVGWKHNKEICGGGVWFDLGSHCVDLIYHLCGSFDTIMGMEQIAFETHPTTQTLSWQTNADEAFYAICRLQNGACGNITVSKITCGANDDLSVRIHGDKGSLRFSLMQPNFLYFYNSKDIDGTYGSMRGYRAIECVGRYPTPGGAFPSPKAPSSWLRGHVQSMYDFLSAVSQGVHSHPDFSDGAYVQAVLEAGYHSAEIGKFVKVSDVSDTQEEA